MAKSHQIEGQNLEKGGKCRNFALSIRNQEVGHLTLLNWPLSNAELPTLRRRETREKKQLTANSQQLTAQH
jgi:hypothetical protein